MEKVPTPKLPKKILSALGIVALADISLTYYGVYYIDSIYEKNEIAIYLMDVFGPIGLLAVYPIGVTFCMFLSFLHPWEDTAFKWLLIVYLVFSIGVVLNNTRLILQYV